MGLKEFIRRNMYLKFKIKGIQRRGFVKKMRGFSHAQLMKYDADLYENRHGYPLDWNNLKTYSEKMQWEKLFNSEDPRKVLCSDKYRVREWVSEKIGEQYLIPLLGVWDRPDEIEFDKLPEQFVLKTNCGSGDIVIVKNRNKLSKWDIKGIRTKLDYFQKMKFGYNTCELHYNYIAPKVIAEQFIDCSYEDLPDYKFLCFNGEPYFCWVDVDRYHKHKRNVYNLDWELQEWNQYRYGNAERTVEKPENFDRMIELARELAAGFSHVRVDLYNIDGKIYFGEMTFTNSSGFEPIVPDGADRMLGDLWKGDFSILMNK